MPKPNLYSMPRKPETRKTFAYSDEQGSIEIELRRLPGVLAYKVNSNTRKLVARFITGAGMPGGKPVGLPPMGSPPRTIKPADLDEGLLSNVATVELMQTATEGDIDNRYTPEDLIALAFDWEAAWWELQVFVREMGEDLEVPKQTEPPTGQAIPQTDGSNTTRSHPESTISISG